MKQRSFFCKSVGLATLCAVQLVQCAPPPIVVKLFKTDPSKFNDTWTYGFSDDLNKTPSSDTMKKIRKQADVSIPLSDFVDKKIILWICPASAACFGDLYKKLDITNINDRPIVIAIDKQGEPTPSTLMEVRYARAANAPAKIKTIDVYKENLNDKKPWKLTAKSVNQKITYGETTIRTDTSGFTSKLKYPINADWDILVDRGSGSVPQSTQFRTEPVSYGDVKNSFHFDSILILDSTGKARIAAKSEKPKKVQLDLDPDL